MMMRRLLLAVMLGVFVGFALAVAPPSISTEAKLSLMPMTTVDEQSRNQFTAPVPSRLEFILFALVAGIIVAAPVFALAKRR